MASCNASSKAGATVDITDFKGSHILAASVPSEMRSHTSCSLEWQAATPQVRLQLLLISQISGGVMFFAASD